jgi:hypothetical protein
MMRSTRVLNFTVAIGFLIGAMAAIPSPAQAVWVNSSGQFQVGGAFQFNIGGQLTTTIVPTASGTSFVDPTCGSQGGTSLALVSGNRAGVNPVLFPVVLVVSCLDNGGSSTIRARLNFISLTDGKVVKQVSTTAVPSNGWAHLVIRPDKGDLLGCGSNGALYSIDFSQPTSAPATQITPIPQVATSCTGLAWDAEADMIYLGLSVSGGNKIGRVVRFQQGSTTLLGDFSSLPCAANGLAISGGVLMMSCNGTLTLQRLDKNTGVSLGAFPTLTATGLPALNNDPGLGDLACDPVTFHQDAAGNDRYTDGLWSRRGANGNGVVALEFPAYTCGLPSSSVVINQNGIPYSPLAAGLSAPSATGVPGAIPRPGCFDALGRVIDADGDGLPDCWETNSTSGNGIDFDGDGIVDLVLCVSVPVGGQYPNPSVTECADPTHKDLFVEIDYMQFHLPNPQALTQAADSVATIGVQSIREAFAAAPVANVAPSGTGINIHFQVDEQLPHFDQIVLTPCTQSTGSVASFVDFDAVKATNFGTVADRANTQTLNAKRLAFRYVIFGHDLAPLASNGGLGSSGCSEVGGDDAVVTLGSFSGSGTIAGHTGGMGSQDEQAGTLMHELGHLLGLRHGGDDDINCKPNYRSVMSYSRQFSGSPIVGRRLDYSRSLDPLISGDPANTGILNEISLNELVGLGVDPSLGPLPAFLNTADQIVFGPGAWSFATANVAPINWNRNKDKKGNPIYETNATANINDGSGCTSLVTNEKLFGHNDWANLVYRSSASLNFAGGRRTEGAEELTQQGAEALYLAADRDGNGAGDGTDCGGTVNPDGTTSFPCKHRIDIKPSFPVPKTINPGTEANITIAIFSEVNGAHVWDASTQVLLTNLATFPLTFSVESFQVSVKVNNNGGGTCSISDVADPITGQKDSVKDLKCQFPSTMPDGTPLPKGTHFGIVSGFFFDPLTGDTREFSARQEVTIL